MPSFQYFSEADYPLPQQPNQAAGLGLRPELYNNFDTHFPNVGWVEVHPENYFGGGFHRHQLCQVRQSYPLSFHAVGLSLGSDQPVNTNHLQQLKELIQIYEPFLVSDHVSWSATGNAHLNDLLPLPYTQQTLKRLCNNVSQVQDYLGRRILVENPSSYLSFTHDEMPEYEFINQIAEKTGCGLLLDVNNIFVQASNHNTSAEDYIQHINPHSVAEIHLAGHTERTFPEGTLLVDTHNQPVRPEVWQLYTLAIQRFGKIPTLIEWDADFPTHAVLAEQVDKAQQVINHTLTLHQHAA